MASLLGAAVVGFMAGILAREMWVSAHCVCRCHYPGNKVIHFRSSRCCFRARVSASVPSVTVIRIPVLGVSEKRYEWNPCHTADVIDISEELARRERGRIARRTSGFPRRPRNKKIRPSLKIDCGPFIGGDDSA